MSCQVFFGNLAYSTGLNYLKITTNCSVVVHNGKITSISREKPDETNTNVTILGRNQFLIPGFVDCHVHAPQFPNISLGLNKPLLEWIDNYTYPLEKRYSDVELAKAIYDKVVRRLLKNGTTTASYFGTLHYEATLELAKICAKWNQRALIGKVSIDLKNHHNYFNSTEDELRDTEKFIRSILDMKNDLIEPVITPRFALSCCEELLLSLGNLASKYNLKIQSHISENKEEVKLVEQLHKRKNYADVYDTTNLLNDRTIMGHAIYLTDAEVDLFVSRSASVAHCPASNTRLRSGLCPLRVLLDKGITVGLGTDVSGGDSASILDAIRRCMDVSTQVSFQDDKKSPLDWKEAFYLATMGGAKALRLDHKIGTLEVGKDFDALLIDVYDSDSQIDNYYDILKTNQKKVNMLEEPQSEVTTPTSNSETLTAGILPEHGVTFPNKSDKLSDAEIAKAEEEYRVMGLLQRFVYLGDDRNIKKVFVKGVEIKF